MQMLPKPPILLIAGVETGLGSAAQLAITRITRALEDSGYTVERARTAADGQAFVTSDPSIGCVVLAWDLSGAGDPGHEDAVRIISAIRNHSESLPVFVMADRTSLAEMPLEVVELITEFVWVLEDTPEFIAGRIDYAIGRYADTLLPPFFGKLINFTGEHEYSWHTPGHTGGTAFLRTAVGRAFHDFYGENLVRSDLSVSVEELGSLLDHSGPIGEAEVNASRVFGSDLTYFVLNGTSTANQIVGHSCIVAGDVVLADRNCHKSLNYSLAVTDAVPVYLTPSRNGYGIIGPIPPGHLTPAAVKAAIAASPLAQKAAEAQPVYAVVTNSTYDGLCYDAGRVVRELEASVPRIHFDEAWFAYAKFNPIYRGRLAMDAGDGNGPTLYATQSTHKLLAALSQASMIHIRQGTRAPVDPDLFNEAYMMHGSTSPLYPLIASLDVSAAMMNGPSGKVLTDESIEEAITFRKMVLRVADNFAATGEGGGWFFGVWQPPTVTEPQSGRELSFTDAPDKLLGSEAGCWTLKPGASWHGFGDVEDGYCMLDPIKVTITCPGTDAGGNRSRMGIPAPIVSRFLDARRIVVEKTGDYVFLVLFSMGITKGKWGTLLDSLTAFKRRYDEGAPLAQVIPDLVREHPERYAGVTLPQLCDEMHAEMGAVDVTRLLDEAFDELPEPVLTPGETFRRLVRGEVEDVPVREMGGRIGAVMLVPYPPGIPVLMPGERVPPDGGALVRYLLALEELDGKFPGFEHDTHGVTVKDGVYHTKCLRP